MSRRALFLGVLMLTVAVSPALCQEEDASNSSAEAATTGNLIPNVPTLKWTDGMCMFIGSLNLCLNYLGEKVTYQYLMGVSGAAFATRFHRDWSPSSTDAAMNDDHPKAALQAVGYSYTWATTGDPRVVMGSIDRGVPVICSDLAGKNDWGVIVGHQRMGEIWLGRTYYDRSSAYFRTEKLPWSALILGQKGTAPPMAKNARDSIKLAVEFARGERKLKDPKYAVGFDAYGAWIEALQSKKCQGLVGKELEQTASINAWIFNSLIDARYAGVTYLTWAATVLKGDAKTHCEEAAALYQEEIDALRSAKDYVKYPQNITSGPKWSADMRAYQIEALKQALEKDKAAVAALQMIVNEKEN
jgi:hypothetical protein